MLGPGIPDRSVRCRTILVAGVFVSHADEVRQPARLEKVSNITATSRFAWSLPAGPTDQRTHPSWVLDDYSLSFAAERLLARRF
jgi:uncharacterized NAD(P)/FAD-binding protein YdhS